MNEVLLYRLAIIVVALPTLWSILVLSSRSIGQRAMSGMFLQDRIEKTILMVMVAPYLIGAGVVFIGHYGPNVLPLLSSFTPPLLSSLVPPTPDFLIHDLQDEPGVIPPWGAINVFSVMGILSVGFIIYGVGVCLGVLRLGRALIYMLHTERLSMQYKTNRNQTLRLTDKTLSPYVTRQGHIIFSRPLLDHFNKADLDLILHHERTHARRGDPIYFWALAWVDIIFWFNPVMRYQTSQCRLAAELACDYSTLTAFPGRHKDYARTMLSVVKFMRHQKPVVSAGYTPHLISFTPKGDLTMRLKQIMQFQEKSLSDKIQTKSVIALYALSLAAVPLCLSQISLASYANAETVLHDHDQAQPTLLTASNANFTVRAVNFALSPLNGRVSSRYGQRIHPISKEPVFHHGIDIVADKGTKIIAPSAGTVLRVREDYKGYGNLLEIEHGDGFVTRYGQLSAFDVKEGELVVAEQTIARVGASGQATGPHLHLELWKDSQSIDPESMIPIVDLKKK